MADCVTPQQIEDTAAALNEHGLVTLDDLRMCISRDVNTGIRWVSINTGVSAALLMALLIAEAGDEAGRKGKRELLSYWHSLRQSALHPKRIWHNRRKHWLDVLAVLVVLFLSIGLVLRVRSIGKEKDQYVAVKQGANLPVFHKITDEVEMKSASESKGSFTKIEQVLGRYTLTTMPAGAMLQSAQLLSDELSKKIQGRKLLSVPLKAGAYSAALSAPSEATMVLSPREPDLKNLAPQSFDVVLLRIESSGDAKSATVALPEDKLNSAATLLASHDVFLVRIIN